jgi:hypothetical protein
MSLTLSQVAGEGSEPCFLHIRRLNDLRGYTVGGVGLVSGARTVEVYGGDEDYIATCKGVVSGDSHGDGSQ